MTWQRLEDLKRAGATRPDGAAGRADAGMTRAPAELLNRAGLDCAAMPRARRRCGGRRRSRASRDGRSRRDDPRRGARATAMPPLRALHATLRRRRTATISPSAPSEFARPTAALPPSLARRHRRGGARASSASTAPACRGVFASTPRRACAANASCAPIARVGLYVPAGLRAAAFDRADARRAGAPGRLPRRGAVHAAARATAAPIRPCCYAARRCGITRVFKLGGAQAIAAMAFGTDSVPRCDKLFGPGNAYVTEAKRQVVDGRRAAPAIDMPAGPSEVLVIADAGANPCVRRRRPAVAGRARRRIRRCCCSATTTRCSTR